MVDLIKTPRRRLLLCLAFFFCSLGAQARPLKITFLNPATEKEVFWSQFTSFMEFAADDLGVDLEVVYSNHDRFKSLEIARRILASPDKPDFLVFQMQAQVGPQILAAAEDAKVGSLVVNTDIPEQDRARVGEPREKYRYWLGHLFPDDQQAGYTLAEALVKSAQDHETDNPIELVALSGSRDNQATRDRNRGLENFVRDHGNVELKQIVYASWDRQIARNMAHTLLRRYPKTRVIWAASDLMALGAVEASRVAGRTVEQDVFVGGVDWTTEGLRAVANDHLTASVGGHFMEGGWAIVLLYDYARGKDFAPTMGTTIRTPMNLATKENAGRFLAQTTANDWSEIDFRQFSRTFHPTREEYEFCLCAAE
ncbi:ABC transporter substrate-binding protein [Marinobacteraceae bacterium S3BR75-40.1]